MTLYLSPQLKIKDIKKYFSRSYPYLKIEIFKQQMYSTKDGISQKDIAPDSARLLEITGVMKEGEIEITPKHTVAEAEQIFQNTFFLPVRIFCKSKFSWIETTKTNQMTLEKQNRIGSAACGAIFDLEILL